MLRLAGHDLPRDKTSLSNKTRSIESSVKDMSLKPHPVFIRDAVDRFTLMNIVLVVGQCLQGMFKDLQGELN